MCKREKFKLLTLVVNITSAFVIFSSGPALATPHLDSPMPVANEDDATSALDPFEKENISITDVKKDNSAMDSFVGRFNKASYFYPYRQELELHAGVVFGISDSSDDEDLMNGVLGFSYLVPRRISPKWELGADLSLVGHGHIRVARRFIYNEKGAFRPYYELGVMHKMVPDEKFASLSNWDNYLFRAGIGFANIMRPPKSVQLELEIAIGAEDILAFFSYGYAWGF